MKKYMIIGNQSYGVIPAKSGIQYLQQFMDLHLDSRLRGNDTSETSSTGTKKR